MDSEEPFTPPLSPPKATVEDECWWCDESLLSDLAAWWGDETHEETPKNDAEEVDGALKDGLVQDSP